MLTTYTPVSALSPAERQQLLSTLPRMVLEGRAYVDIGGKYIACSELMEIKRSMQPAPQRQRLFE